MQRIKEYINVYISNYRIPDVAGDNLVQLQDGALGTEKV